MYKSLMALAFVTATIASRSPLFAQTGLLVVAHGADTEWNGQVRETVGQVRWDGPTATAFLMGPEAAVAGWHQAVASLLSRGARDIVVVPLMVSSHGSHFRQILYYAGRTDSLPAELASHGHPEREALPVPVRVTAALDAAPEMLDALVDRWRALDAPRRRAPLVLLGHGPQDPDDVRRWLAAFDLALTRLRREGFAGDGRAALLQDDADAEVRAAAVRGIRDTVAALAIRTGDSVTVMTVLVSHGGIQRVTVPRDLEGLPVRYAPVSLTPLPAIARWIERVARERLASPER